MVDDNETQDILFLPKYFGQSHNDLLGEKFSVY